MDARYIQIYLEYVEKIPMKTPAILSAIIVITSVSCAYSSILLPEYAQSTQTPQNTATSYQRPTQTPFPDPTKLTELVVETSSALTPLPTTKAEIDILNAECIPTGSELHGIVLSVIDGATLEVEVEERIITVRYIGLDTSESVLDDQPVMVFSQEALEKNKELVKGKDIVLYRDVSMTDGYGRLLAYVLTDGIFVNYEMIRQGYALSAVYPPDDSCAETFQNAEAIARSGKEGMWSRLAE